MAQTIEFYFDFISPYSYFAWLQLPQLKKEHDLNFTIKPVLLAGILNHYGQKGPAEIIPKRDALFRTCLRYAAKNNIEFTTPKFHPFNPLYVLRLALKSTSGQWQEKVIDTIWKAGWTQGIDLGNPEEIEKVLNQAGLPGSDLLENTFLRENKKALKENTQEAIEKGIFGVPSFVYKKEVFWGNDSIHDLLSVVKGQDLLDYKKYEILREKTASAARQKMP